MILICLSINRFVFIEFDVELKPLDEKVSDIQNKVKFGIRDAIGILGKNIALFKFWKSKNQDSQCKYEYSKFKFEFPSVLIPNLIQSLEILKKEIKKIK